MAAPAGSQHRCVFVGNIPYDATEEQLIQICEEVGPVVSFRLVLDRETGKPKGYGFCEYKDEETALSARRNLQGYEINGRQLRVDFAENDKNADRSREQGRGGPGLSTSAEAQNQFGGTPIVDPSLLLPIGLPSAVNAATLMAGALGGAQTAYLPNAQGQSEIGTDPLTRYLSGMSRHQLNEIMSEMKTLATQNRALAQQLLLGSPQLLKALFQALIMMGMVSPQMMQLANTRKSSSSFLPRSLPVGQLPLQKEALAGTLTKPLEYQIPITAHNAGVLHQGILPQQVHFRPQNLPHTAVPRDQPVHGTAMPAVPPSVWPQSQGSLPVQPAPLPTSKLLSKQSQVPLVDQHRRSVAVANLEHHPQLSLPNTTLQQSVLPPPVSQIGTSSGLVPPKKEVLAPSNILTSTRDPQVRTQTLDTLTEQTRMVGHNLSVTLERLEDRTLAPQVVNSSIPSLSNASVQGLGAGVSSRSQTVGANEAQHSQKQILELPSDVESGLLQQVLSLTPEQLSSLPLEQQQQVLQLQQLLSASK